MSDSLQDRADRFYGEASASHVGHGLGKGLVSVGRGVYGGAAALVLSPVLGAKKDGVLGFAKGSASGLASFFALPVGGVVQGARQVCSGIIHTPNAVQALMHKDNAEAAADDCSVGDPDARNDEVYSAARDAVFGAAPMGKAAAPAEREKRYAKETALYEALNLNPNATADEITRSYHRLANQFHPDKHSGDEVALSRFEEVSVAYQVLIDPAKRDSYDRHGYAALAHDFVDPGAFFTAQFGSAAFAPYVGELLVAYAAGREASKQELDVFQAKRERDLAVQLLARLETWLDGREEEFVADMLVEATRLRDGAPAFGGHLLQCIGYTYYNCAEVLLGLSSALGLPGYLHLAGLKSHEFKSRVSAIFSAMHIRDMRREMEAEGKGELEEGDVPRFLRNVWMVSVVDIESTLRKVVEMAVKVIPRDNSGGPLQKEEKKRRATGVLKLGRVFLSAADSAVPCGTAAPAAGSARKNA